MRGNSGPEICILDSTCKCNSVSYGRGGRALNRHFRGKDQATNVLTFVYDELQPLCGDIVLCVPVVMREAQQQLKNLRAHYAHLTVHGVLHLQGYDHERDAEAQVMEQLETNIITRLGYVDPYHAH